MGDDNWQMDVISRLSSWDRAGFINEDGSKTLFVDQNDYMEDYSNNPDAPANYSDLRMSGVTSLSTADLDGNGLGDIILMDGGRVHAYYNMGDDNWQMDVISRFRISSWGSAGFINEDGSKTLFVDQIR